jgi:hypothetical protein
MSVDCLAFFEGVIVNQHSIHAVGLCLNNGKEKKLKPRQKRRTTTIKMTKKYIRDKKHSKS